MVHIVVHVHVRLNRYMCMNFYMGEDILVCLCVYFVCLFLCGFVCLSVCELLCVCVFASVHVCLHVCLHMSVSVRTCVNDVEDVY